MKKPSTMTIGELYQHLDTLYPKVPVSELIALRRLKRNLESWAKPNGDFSKLTVKEVEAQCPYFLLETSHPSVPAFLLYAKIIKDKY